MVAETSIPPATTTTCHTPPTALCPHPRGVIEAERKRRPLSEMSAAELVALLPICPACGRHAPCPLTGVCDDCTDEEAEEYDECEEAERRAEARAYSNSDGSLP